jgi:4-hydroxy-tetrahydrodipicolinate reductase
MRIGVCGAGGRMGRAIMRIAIGRGHAIGAAFEHPSSPHIGADAAVLAGAGPSGVLVAPFSGDQLARVDGIVDFTAPAATMEIIPIVSAGGKPAVIGTTGLSADQRAEVYRFAAQIPVLLSPNMSLGVNLLFRLTQIAAETLQDGFDIEVFEAHHRFKKDAPSGTARRLIEIIKESSIPLKDAPEMYDRAARMGERSNAEIGVQVLRGGDIVGEHTVYFVGMGERIELTHRATDRDILAKGAVTALEFLVGKKPGMYSMFDVLGFN